MVIVVVSMAVATVVVVAGMARGLAGRRAGGSGRLTLVLVGIITPSAGATGDTALLLGVVIFIVGIARGALGGSGRGLGASLVQTASLLPIPRRWSAT